MIRKIFFVLTILLFTSTYSYSQESCSCSSTAGGCSASQSCPAGKSATCVCTSNGCSSSCSRGDVLPEGGGESRVTNTNAGNLDNVLSYVSGLNIKFTPTNKNYKFSGLDNFKSSSSDLLDELAQNGEVSINGQKADFWKGVRKTLLEGGEFRLCFGGATANKILNTVSFISGKRYLITSGDANREITGQIKGNNLSEVLESLQKISGTTIVENN